MGTVLSFLSTGQLGQIPTKDAISGSFRPGYNTSVIRGSKIIVSANFASGTTGTPYFYRLYLRIAGGVEYKQDLQFFNTTTTLTYMGYIFTVKGTNDSIVVEIEITGDAAGSLEINRLDIIVR